MVRQAGNGEDLVYGAVILSVDPGTHTGAAVLHLDLRFLDGVPVRDSVLGCWSDTLVGTEHQIVDELVRLACRWPNAICLSEDFVLRQSGAEGGKGGRALLSPVRISGAWHYALHRMSRPLHYQGSSLIEKVKKEHLEAAGVWWIGMGTPLGAHAADAVAHALVLARRAQRDQGIRRLFTGEVVV
jgi:hypothetical protein